MIYHGNMFKNSPKIIIGFFQERPLIELAMEDFPKEEFSIEELIRGDLQMKHDIMPFLGGYILPPVWFGDLPTMEEILKGRPLSKYITTIKHEEISGRRIIIKILMVNMNY